MRRWLGGRRRGSTHRKEVAEKKRACAPSREERRCTENVRSGRPSCGGPGRLRVFPQEARCHRQRRKKTAINTALTTTNEKVYQMFVGSPAVSRRSTKLERGVSSKGLATGRSQTRSAPAAAEAWAYVGISFIRHCLVEVTQNHQKASTWFSES